MRGRKPHGGLDARRAARVRLPWAPRRGASPCSGALRYGRDVAQQVPLPSEDLTYRVFLQAHDRFELTGQVTAAAVSGRLPSDWDWEGKRILEFGCGAGRILRHFVSEARRCDFYACDIHRPSVAWLEEHLAPPFRVFANDPRPPIAMPDGSFDLIYAVSVFTHLTDQWAPWLLELHRLLKPGGLLLSTFMGEGVWPAAAFEEPWDAERVGMLAHRLSTPWAQGGPTVYHSSWWIDDRWARLFQIEAIATAGFRPPGYQPDHGYVLARKLERLCTPEALAAPGPDPRELRALQHQVDVLVREGLAERERPIAGREAARALGAAVRRRVRGAG